jgi:catechol 2,3-dioxygenase-like lactoylglutathione lyase family enzyme
VSSQLKSLCFLAHNPQDLAHFWAETLNWSVKDETSARVELTPSDGTRFTVIFVPASEKKRGKNRLHIDLSTTSLDDQASMVERLTKLGAHHINIGQGSDAPYVVLADPDGNEFCVLEPGNSFVTYQSRLGSITCDGSREVGYFWSKVLGWPLVWDQDEETAIRDPDGTGVFIT